MTLEELRKIAEARTKGNFRIVYEGHGENCHPALIHVFEKVSGSFYEVVVDHRRDFTDPAPDARAISIAMNHIDALLDVVEAAKNYRWHGIVGSAHDLDEALKKLEEL